MALRLLKDDELPKKDTLESGIKPISMSEEIIEDNITDKNKEISVEIDDSKYTELNGKYIQMCSDFANYKKRTKREKEVLSDNQTVEVIRSMLPLIDSLENGVKYEDDLNADNVICILYRQLQKFFTELGIEEINDKGMMFNPHYNEAIGTKVVPGNEHGTIVTVLRKGYKYHHQIIRQSIVEISE